MRRLPVVNAKGRLIGIISLDDILLELTGQLRQVQKLLQAERASGNVDEVTPD